MDEDEDYKMKVESQDDIVKMRIEIMHLKGKLKNTQVQKELELEQIMGKMELEKEQLRSKMELEKERLRSDIRANQIQFKAEIERLTNDHAHENWNYLKTLRKLDLRVFINKFESKHCPGEEHRRIRFRKYAEKKKDLLSPWGFTPSEFMNVFEDLYYYLNETAHPVFEIGQEITISADFFNNYQLKVLGFLWERYPLPLKLFKLKTEDSSVKTIKDLRKRENRKRKLE